MIKKFCLPILFIIFQVAGYQTVIMAQNVNYTSPVIKSVFFEKDNHIQAYPVMALSEAGALTLHFDILSDYSETLYYKVIHCDREWNISDLFYSDYIEGFEENSLSSSGASFNTKIAYSHYKLMLPNEDMKLKISGNYLLIVYRSGEDETPLLRRRIMVHEGAAPLNVTFRRPTGKDYNTGQQSEVTISLSDPGITDPSRQITLTILQNGRYDRAKSGIKPDFIGDGTIMYNTLNGSTLFDGGNEFRYFDIKNIRQKLQNVRAIEYNNGNYHIFLLPSENREYKQHFNNEDLNGRYYIALENSNEPDLDADYVYVYFTLPAKEEVADGAIYVSGALTNWEYTPENKMIYNDEKGWYEAVLLLKQGWYNYEYVFIPGGRSKPEGNAFEGSHYETENDYLMLVYFHDPRQRYDRLMDCYITNSIGKQR